MSISFKNKYKEKKIKMKIKIEDINQNVKINAKVERCLFKNFFFQK